MGSLIAKPVMALQVDPVMASAVRVTVATSAHAVLLLAGFKASRAQQPATLRVLGQTAVSYTHLDVYKRQNLSRR